MKKLIEYIYSLLGYYKAHTSKGVSNRTTKNYRKIWSDANGPIPVDKNGKTFDIHHVDGNSHNCDLSNLIAVSRAHHIQIHYWQGDHGAVALLEGRVRPWWDRRKKAKKPSKNAELVMVYNDKGRLIDCGYTKDISDKYNIKGYNIGHCCKARPDGRRDKSAKDPNGVEYQFRYKSEVGDIDNIGSVKRRQKSGGHRTNARYFMTWDLKVFKGQRSLGEYLNQPLIGGIPEGFNDAIEITKEEYYYLSELKPL